MPRKPASQPASKKRANLSPDEIKILQYVFGCAMVSISDIADDIYRGAGITREEVSEAGTPCVRYGELYTTYGIQFSKCASHTYSDSGKWFSHGDILFAITGESVEDIASSTAYLGEERALAGGDLVVLKHSQEPRFLSYVLSTTDVRNQKSKGKIKSKVVHSSVPAIKNIQIPLPPIEKQKEVSDTLDVLYRLCYDLEQGIPAEIQLYRKRSEYYRDSIFMAFSV